MLSESLENQYPDNYQPMPVSDAGPEDIEAYLAGSLRGGPGWHYCYIDKKGSWKNDSGCEHC